jgi:hypothetical protein
VDISASILESLFPTSAPPSLTVASLLPLAQKDQIESCLVLKKQGRLTSDQILSTAILNSHKIEGGDITKL